MIPTIVVDSDEYFLRDALPEKIRPFVCHGKFIAKNKPRVVYQVVPTSAIWY